VCAWDDFDAHCSAIIDAIRNGKHVAHPFDFLNLSSAPADQLQCAKLYCADRFPPSGQPVRQGGRAIHRRIRLAYISADFRDHAVSYLLAGVFERHDRSRFETIAVSLYSGLHSEMQVRLRTAFDRFIDASRRSDRDVHQLLLELDVDIAVDLTGFTAGGRSKIFAHRAAPVQVNYLGYPGTTGANFIDYIIADRYAIPEDQQRHYSEKVAYLPDSFQANDSTRQMVPRSVSRAEFGLPETGFVFCSFNNNYKITPTVFNIWLNLLRDVKGSVLWLYASNVAAERNLRRQALAHGIAADRLIFAPGIAYSDHMARIQLGNLFLDTFPFNAGTTASDALWSGLPVVTCSGRALASRMAGSVLHAAGLPELVTETLEEYATLASMLACDPPRLARIKEKLARNRSTCALFDTARFTRHIEAAYAAMRERHLRGEPPATFSVKPIN
jgi:predicted O-linked N-acetylglucosamine transferase (SPINDLY family)